MAVAAKPRVVGTAAERSIAVGPLIAFSTLAAPIAAAQMPLSVYLPASYAQQFGIPLALLGIVFFAEKLWGALADPLIGLVSDRTNTRFGRRRSWIVLGALLFGLSGLALFFPPGRFVGVTWLGVSLFFFYLGWSMIQIPYFAWSGEISRDHHERTRIVSYQAVVSSIALLLVLLAPTLIDQVHPGASSSKLAAMGGIIIATLLIALPLTLRALPEGGDVADAPDRPGIVATLRTVASDGPLMRVLASDFVVTTGQSVRAALFVFFVSDYMLLPRWASGLYLLQFIFSIAAGPVWLTVARHFGKLRAMLLGETLQVLINLALLVATPGHIGFLVAMTGLQGLSMGSGNLMLRSMVADAAERHRHETGCDRTALFFSVFSLSMKAAMAVAVGVALPLVAWAGFDPAATRNDEFALRVLLLAFALGPAITHALAALIIRKFPIEKMSVPEGEEPLAEIQFG